MYDTLISRFADLSRRHSSADSPPERLRQLVDTLDDHGRWPDVQYEDTSRADWKPTEHLRRLVQLSLAIDEAERPDTELVRGARAALDGWLELRPRAVNWWHNRIGVPLQMMHIVVLLRPHLSDQQYTGALDVLRQFQTDNPEFGPWMAGANTIWLAKFAILYGALTADGELIHEASQRIAGEIEITTGEGIQPDFSFHQHNAQLYSGGYGTVFLSDTVLLSWVLRETPWAVPREKIEVLSKFLLEGIQWLIYRGRMNLCATGRGIARKMGYPSNQAGETAMSRTARTLAELDPAHREALEAAALRINANDGQAVEPLEGVRHYWRSNLTVQRRTRFASSVLAVSSRTFSMESINDENLLGAHMNEGLTLLWQRGDEYDDMPALWDWRRLPGVTGSPEAEMPEPRAFRKWGPTSFVGGVAEGSLGVHACSFTSLHEQPPIRGRKAWFFFEDFTVWLGADIRWATDLPVVTTFAQRPGVAPVVNRNSEGRRTYEAKEREHTVEGWTWHDGIGYLPLDGRPRRFTLSDREGSWHRVNRKYPDEPIRGTVFTYGVDHGRAPSHESYAELIQPGVDADAFARLAGDPPVEVFCNTAECQAVRRGEDGRLLAAFYEPAELCVSDSLHLHPHQPCVLIWRQTGDGYRLTLADPTHKLATASISINGRPRSIDLPVAGHAGGSVTVEGDPTPPR